MKSGKDANSLSAISFDHRNLIISRACSAVPSPSFSKHSSLTPPSRYTSTTHPDPITPAGHRPWRTSTSRPQR
ncbi:hypothetical protein CC86DRAFT_371414 [Ophiobolus disseminans]|uniref:Uncharacterized protein n=1 Tax=Ophiobolus disseminans TaxID=1469910 RepID=A0A6A6ZW39_9PLEO|nr:hypothetical protein CC86DRAFT_371414 [Ophiobolus disseminans]